MSTDAYEALLAHVREVNTARAIESLLDWDQETFMPRRAAADRANQAALMAGVSHARLTSDELLTALSAAETDGSAADASAAVVLREVRREVDRALKLPGALVQATAKATILAKDAWNRARQSNDFAAFAPHLQQVLELKREAADRIGWKLERYDALLDEFEPGATAAEIEPLFAMLRQELVPLVRAIAAAPRRPDLSVLARPCPSERQAAFNRRVAEAMGFDFSAGRLDVSAHPFCSGLSPLDVRLTTRYDDRYLPTSLFGVLHEVGHGLYEQGLDPAHIGTPLAQAASLGVHESQSRLWENLVGRSRPFWQHFFPLLVAEFPSLSDVTLDAWYFAINAVQPSFIRVEADEVTYGLHIMLRFDLERRMIAGSLAVRDLPQAWNEEFKTLLGLTPPDDARGCLQDIHWSLGIFGYFPTYQLGNLYAAQLFEAARRALPDLDAQLAAGELLGLRDWLRRSIHQHGKRYRAAELLRRVTGEAPRPDALLRHLNSKLAPLYGI